ncbi:MAG: ABC transporter ATP-binding protein [Candidatus Hodarchaeales archaeon]
MVIAIENLVKKFGERTVIDDLSLEINREIFSVLGPNGSGKTTLVNILCGLLRREGGKVQVNGLDPAKNPGAVRKKIGLVTQETALYEYLTAKENLEFHAKFYGVPKNQRKQKVKEALQLSQLEDRAKDRVHTFSGGMKRRLALVRSLIHDPEIVILDEPSLGIDVQNRNEIWNKILELKGEKTVLVNTNYMDEADKLAERIAIIDRGKLVALDTPKALKARAAGGVRLEARIEMEDDIKPLQVSLGEISSKTRITKETDGNYYSILMPANKQPYELLNEVSQILQSFPNIILKDLNIRVPTLADVFLELTGTKLRD